MIKNDGFQIHLVDAKEDTEQSSQEPHDAAVFLTVGPQIRFEIRVGNPSAGRLPISAYLSAVKFLPTSNVSRVAGGFFGNHSRSSLSLARIERAGLFTSGSGSLLASDSSARCKTVDTLTTAFVLV